MPTPVHSERENPAFISQLNTVTSASCVPAMFINVTESIRRDQIALADSFVMIKIVISGNDQNCQKLTGS